MNHVTHPLISAGISVFHHKSASFAISRNANIDCVLIRNFNSFNLFRVLKDCFNKHGYNFDDVIKNGNTKPS